MDGYYATRSRGQRKSVITEVASFDGALELIRMNPKLLGHSIKEDGTHYGAFGCLEIDAIEYSKQLQLVLYGSE